MSGVVCNISEEFLEIASTDGNRLARYREAIDNKGKKTAVLIVPSKILNEVMKMSSFISDDTVKIYTKDSKIVIKSERTTTVSRLVEGQYPRYNQFIPDNYPKKAVVNVHKMIAALERVSVMVNEKTNIVCLTFADNNLKMESYAPSAGKSQDDIDIDYTGGELTIAFNYKFVLEVLRNMESDNVIIQLNTPLSATMFAPESQEDYLCLIMPVQLHQQKQEQEEEEQEEVQE